ELRNGRAALLAGSEVEAGRYDRLRLHLAGGEVRADGTTHALRLAASHVDLDGPFLLRDGEGIELHIDFNVRMSVLEADGSWTLRPRLSLVDAGAGAFVSGAVEPAAATVSAQQAGTEIASTRTDADGTFRLGPLPAGSYALVVTAPGFLPEVESGVALHAGATSAGYLFQLSPAAAGAVTGLAPPGSLVVWVLRDGALVAIAGVSADGDFTASLPPGSYDVEFHDDRGLVATDRLVVDP
ncbi:MAG: carboxypeptidase regulatory-like domain-containing protein, partial [Planctomycetota bacterium]